MTRFPVALILFVAAVLPATALGQAETAAARRAALVAAAPKGPEFENDRRTYRVVTGMQAVKLGDATANARAAALGLPATAVVEQRGPYAIVERGAATGTLASAVEAASAVSAIAAEPSYPVVVNTRTGQLGVVSGTIIVKLATVADADALAKANGLSVEYVAEPIGFVFLGAPAGTDVLAMTAALGRDPRVILAYAEIREHFAVPR
jgi:hypothetical protein